MIMLNNNNIGHKIKKKVHTFKLGPINKLNLQIPNRELYVKN